MKKYIVILFILIATSQGHASGSAILRYFSDFLVGVESKQLSSAEDLLVAFESYLGKKGVVTNAELSQLMRAFVKNEELVDQLLKSPQFEQYLTRLARNPEAGPYTMRLFATISSQHPEKSAQMSKLVTEIYHIYLRDVGVSKVPSALVEVAGDATMRGILDQAGDLVMNIYLAFTLKHAGPDLFLNCSLRKQYGDEAWQSFYKRLERNANQIDDNNVYAGIFHLNLEVR